MTKASAAGAEPDRASDGSRLVSAARLQWGLREAGEGAGVLLLHGTGASTHSWALLAPLLAQNARVLMPDLPGHGLTSTPANSQLTIEGMAAAVAELLDRLEFEPAIVIGHSAGAAVMAQMCLDRAIEPATLISLNGALQPFGGYSNPIVARLTRMVASAPLLPRLLSYRLARRQSVTRLITQIGSSLSPAQVDAYVALLESDKHVSAALRMMANWDLAALARRLPALTLPLELVACGEDRAVPPAQAERLAASLPNARLHRLPGLGHLGHEEDPERVFALIRVLAADAGIEIGEQG